MYAFEKTQAGSVRYIERLSLLSAIELSAATPAQGRFNWISPKNASDNRQLRQNARFGCHESAGHRLSLLEISLCQRRQLRSVSRNHTLKRPTALKGKLTFSENIQF